jgi:hypothetical protein
VQGGWKEGVVRGVDLMKSTMEWLQNIDVEAESFEQVDDGTPQRRTKLTPQNW